MELGTLVLKDLGSKPLAPPSPALPHLLGRGLGAHTSILARNSSAMLDPLALSPHIQSVPRFGDSASFILDTWAVPHGHPPLPTTRGFLAFRHCLLNGVLPPALLSHCYSQMHPPDFSQ